MPIWVEWATAWKKCRRCGGAVSFAGRNRTVCTMEDRKAQQTAADEYFYSAKLVMKPYFHAVARPREQIEQHKLKNQGRLHE